METHLNERAFENLAGTVYTIPEISGSVYTIPDKQLIQEEHNLETCFLLLKTKTSHVA